MSNVPAGADKPVFLYHDGALGDVLLSLPSIRRAAAREGGLHFAGRGDVGTLLRESGVVTSASSTAAARYASLYGGTADNAARAFLSDFGRAIVFTVDPDSALVRSIRSVLYETQAVLTVPPEGSGIPVAEFQAAQLGGDAAPADPLLPVLRIHRELAAGMLSRAGHDGLRPVLAVHPGSGSDRKNWPLDRFFGVLDRCRERSDLFIILFSGPAEEGDAQDRMEDFARRRGGILHVAGADLSAVAALLHAAGRYLGNDSGVSHLAAAVGCRALVLYGPTDPIRWRPAGAPVAALRSTDLSDLAVDAVAGRLLRALDAPTGNRP